MFIKKERKVSLITVLKLVFKKVLSKVSQMFFKYSYMKTRTRSLVKKKKVFIFILNGFLSSSLSFFSDKAYIISKLCFNFFYIEECEYIRIKKKNLFVLVFSSDVFKVFTVWYIYSI